MWSHDPKALALLSFISAQSHCCICGAMICGFHCPSVVHAPSQLLHQPLTDIGDPLLLDHMTAPKLNNKIIIYIALFYKRYAAKVGKMGEGIYFITKNHLIFQTSISQLKDIYCIWDFQCAFQRKYNAYISYKKNIFITKKYQKKDKVYLKSSRNMTIFRRCDGYKATGLKFMALDKVHPHPRGGNFDKFCRKRVNDK